VDVVNEQVEVLRAAVVNQLQGLLEMMPQTRDKATPSADPSAWQSVEPSARPS